MIIPDTDQWNRKLWERVCTRNKIWWNFSLCLSSLLEHDPFLEGAFSQTWWFVDSYYIAPCGCTVAMLIAQGLPIVHGLDAWLCCSFRLFISFNLLAQQTLLHIVFLHPSAWKGTDKVLMVMRPCNSTSPLGGIATLSVASYYWDPHEIRLCEPHWHLYDFNTNLIPRVLSLPLSRKYPGCSWSRVNVYES